MLQIVVSQTTYSILKRKNLGEVSNKSREFPVPEIVWWAACPSKVKDFSVRRLTGLGARHNTSLTSK